MDLEQQGATQLGHQCLHIHPSLSRFYIIFHNPPNLFCIGTGTNALVMLDCLEAQLDKSTVTGH